MKTSLKRITTKDNIELVGLLHEPDTGSDTVLVHVHGMAGNFYENKFLDNIAETLTNSGIAFFAFNNRGCESIKDLTATVDGKKKFVKVGNAYEKFEDCLLDIGAAIDAVSTWGFSKIHLSGHSLGSPKVSYYLATTADSRVNSVLLLSPSDMLGLVRSDSERFKKDIKEATDKVTSGRGNELLSTQVWDEYPISGATYLSLFGDDSPVAVFNFHKPSDRLETLGKIHQPLIVIMGRKDDSLVVSIEETMERITNACTKSPHVETVILGDANHGYFGDEQALADAIKIWILKI